MTDLRDQYRIVERLQAAVGDSYRLERELTGGGMSRLFVATEVSLNRRVVIKLLPPDTASAVSAARFRREMELAAGLQHPHILPVLAAGSADDLLYFVMPYVPGESLRRRLERERKLPIADAQRMLLEIADALAHAHAHGIVHRDVKPENILLQDDHVVLADFGVARALVEAEHEGRLTETGLTVGTPGYMAPEQVAGERHIDARADVYALAVVGYEMLTGEPPFAGRTAQEVIAGHLTAAPRPIRDLRPDAPNAVAGAIARALSKSPDERFPTAGAFLEALRSAERPEATARSPRRLMIGMAALVAVALAALVLWPRSDPALGDDTIAVAPFDVIGTGLDVWSEGLVDVLTRNLDGAGELRTIAPTVIVRQWSGRADRESAIALGRATGAQYVLVGSLIGAGPDSVTARASVIDIAAGRRVGGEIERRGLASRMDLLADSLTLSVLRELDTPGLDRGVSLASIGSTSLPAIKSFLRGEQHVRRSAWDSAIVHFTHAVEQDTAFALANQRLALALGWQSNAFDEQSRAYTRRAARHNRGLAPRDSLLLVVDSLEQAMLALELDTLYWPHARRAFATARATAERYPDDPMVWYQLGELYFHHGVGPFEVPMREIVATFDRAIALDSAFAPSYIHQMELALTLADEEAARRYTTAFLAQEPGGEGSQIGNLTLQLLDAHPRGTEAVRQVLANAQTHALMHATASMGRWGPATELNLLLLDELRERRAGPPSPPELLEWRASTLGHRGRVAEVARLSPGLADAWYSSSLTTFLGLVGAMPAEEAARRLRTRLQQGKLDPLSGLALFVSLGDTAAIQRTLALTADSIRAAADPAAAKLLRHDQQIAQAALALARRDTAEALRLFRAAPDTLCVMCFENHFLEARLLAAVGRFDEAEELLSTRLFRYTIPWEPLIAMEHARVLERLGRREEAQDAYAFVAGIWATADSTLQPVVREAREALDRLRAER